MPLLILVVVVMLFVLANWNKFSAGLKSLTPATGAPADTGASQQPSVPAQSTAHVSGVFSVQDNLDNLLQGFFQMEGGRPGDANVRYNNPMNLRSWPTAIGVGKVADGADAIFADQGDGWDAATAWITQQVNRHPDWTLTELANQALGPNRPDTPEEQARTDNYASYLANYMGTTEDTPLSQLLGMG